MVGSGGRNFHHSSLKTRKKCKQSERIYFWWNKIQIVIQTRLGVEEALPYDGGKAPNEN